MKRLLCMLLALVMTFGLVGYERRRGRVHH